MQQSAWLQKRRSRTWVWPVVVGSVVVAAVILFLRNNPEILSRHAGPPAASGTEDQSHQTPKTEEAHPAPAVDRQADVRQSAAVRTETPATPPATSTAVGMRTPDEPTRSVVIPRIECTTSDKSDIRIVISIELFCDTDSMRDEVMVKREQLKVMVRKVFGRKQIGDIQVETLRSELLSEMNGFLGHAAIRDVVFRDFRTEKAPRS
jgi:flagellar basal body-associated protein FliL